MPIREKSALNPFTTMFEERMPIYKNEKPFTKNDLQDLHWVIIQSRLTTWRDEMRYWVQFLFTIICYIAIATATYASDESAFKNMEIKITPLPHKVAVGYPHDMSDEYFFDKSISRIFFLDAPIIVKIINVDIDDNEMVLTLENKKYGNGTIKFVSSKDLEKASNDELKLVLHRSISDEKLATVVADNKSKIFHLATCNHLPAGSNRSYFAKKDAWAKGFKECGMCFHEQMYLPGFATEISLQHKAAAELRYYSAQLLDSSMQSRVERIGSNILNSWPYPLIGYRYKFTVVESREINAYALAAGSIFLTSGLINSLESDDELEAVLAHEIAHVEQRHSLQSYNRLVKKQQTQRTLAMIGSIAAGVAVAANNNNAAIAATGVAAVSLSSMLAVELLQHGYSKEVESGADEFAFRYFSNLKKDLIPVKSVFKKLMYHNLCSVQNPDPKNSTHPALEDRITAFESYNTVFPKSLFYHVIRNDIPIEIQVLSYSKRKEGSELLLRVSDLISLRDIITGDTVIRLSNGTSYSDYTLSNNDIHINAWDGLVSATSTMSSLDILNVSEVLIDDHGVDPSTGYPTGRKYKLIKGPYY